MARRAVAGEVDAERGAAAEAAVEAVEEGAVAEAAVEAHQRQPRGPASRVPAEGQAHLHRPRSTAEKIRDFGKLIKIRTIVMCAYVIRHT